jgi:hypothetical protein
MSDATQLVTPNAELLATVSDPTLRRQLAEAWEDLQFEPKVLKVKEFRDDIKWARSRTSDGGIVVVADRGEVQDPKDAMVVLTLETLQTTLIDVIRKATLAARKRGRLSDLLIGLPPVPAAAGSFELDFEGLARQEGEPGEPDVQI